MVAKDQVNSADKVVLGMNEILKPFYDLTFAIETVAASCKESTTIKTEMASLLSKVKNDEENLIKK